jgi:oxalate decarboxylase/phosphoglucose isomerase-like protein (cupin superfamily)
MVSDAAYVRDPESVDLSEALGVPAFLDATTGAIEFGVSVAEVHERLLADLADAGVLAAPETWPSASLGKAVTRIYRRLDDAAVLRRQGLPPDETERGVKLDVTVVLALQQLTSPRRGDEFPKTIGHFHTSLPGEGVPSPDLYQVVWGEGLVLGQYSDAGAVRSLAIPVRRGETVLLPPHLGHLTINTGTTPLVFANVCVRRPHLSYEEHRRYRGGSWLAFFGGEGGVVFRPNEVMQNAGMRLQPLRRAVPSRSTIEWLGLHGGPIAEIISNGGESLSLLEHPSRHMELFVGALEELGD